MKYEVKIVVNGVEHDARMDGIITIPFECEYVIRIYGSHDGRRAASKIWLDGISLTGGSGLVVPERGYVDLETPVADPGHKFRFTSVDSTQAHTAGKGGPDIDGSKGLIRLEIYAEKQRPRPLYTPRKICLDSYGGEKISRGGIAGQGCLDTSSIPCSADSLSSGVTVEGSSSNQRFIKVEMDIESIATTVLLKLKGFTPEPVVVATSESTINFCSNCGTRLSSLSNLCPSCRRVVR
jgi:hypothetical protein